MLFCVSYVKNLPPLSVSLISTRKVIRFSMPFLEVILFLTNQTSNCDPLTRHKLSTATTSSKFSDVASTSTENQPIFWS